MVFKYKKSLFSNDCIVASNPGSEVIPSYVLDYKTDGGVQLKQNGTKPIYKLIQANKVNCELSTVLEQCVHQNQLAITNQSDVESAIADFTAFSDYADIFTGVKQLGQIWKEMPIDVREQFNSSKSAFISSISDEDFKEKLNAGYAAYYDSIRHRLDNPAPSKIIDNTATVDKIPVIEEKE